jgi:hypothetical protein
MAGTLTVHHCPMRPVVIVIRRERSQPSTIFVLASQYRSHSVPLVNVAQCPRWFLSMGSRRMHSMQKGSGRILMRWRRVLKQSCPMRKRNSATAFLLGQSGVLAISRLHLACEVRCRTCITCLTLPDSLKQHLGVTLCCDMTLLAHQQVPYLH